MQIIVLGLLFGIVAMLTNGVQDFFISTSSKRIGFFSTALWLQSIELFILIIMAIFSAQYLQVNITFGLIIVAITAGVFYGSGLLLFTKGLQVGNVSIITTITAGWGAITAILGAILFSEAINGTQLIAIAMVILGSIMVSFNIRSMFRSGFRRTSAGIVFAVPALMSYGIAFFLLSYLSKQSNWFMAALLITLFNVLTLFVYGRITKRPMKVRVESAPMLLFLGVLGVIALLAYNVGVAYSYTSIVAPVSSAALAITVILATVILKDRLATNQKIGIAMVMAGLIFLSI